MTEGPPPGWYPDPTAGASAGGQLRWWDGTQWTGHVHVPSPSPGQPRRTVPRPLIPGAVLGVVLIGAAALVSVLGGTGSSLEVLGDEDATVAIDGLGGTALPELPTELPDQDWSVPLDAAFQDVGSIGDVVYVTMADFDPDRSPPPRLAAFDAASGDQLWERELEGDGGQVIVEAGEDSIQLLAGYALERAVDDPVSALTVVTSDGDERWSETTRDGDLGAQLLPGPSLLTWSPGDDREEIVDLASGASIHALDGSLVARSASHLVVHDADDDRLRVLDHDGDERWSRDGVSGARAAVSDDLVYLGEDSVVNAYDARSGDRQWQAPLQEEVNRLRPLPGTGVLVSSPDLTTAIDVQGEELWGERLEGTTELHRSDGELELVRIAGDGPGSPLELQRIAAETGERDQRAHLGDDAFVYPDGGRPWPGVTVAGNGLLIASGGSRSAIAYDDLDELWTLEGQDGAPVPVVATMPDGVVAVRFGEFDDDEPDVLEGHR